MPREDHDHQEVPAWRAGVGTFTAALAITILGFAARNSGARLPRAHRAHSRADRPGGSIDTTARVVTGELADCRASRW